MRLKDRIARGLKKYPHILFSDEDVDRLARHVAQEISMSPEVGFTGTFRRDRKKWRQEHDSIANGRTEGKADKAV